MTSAAIHYPNTSGETPAHLAVCWWGDITFADHLFNVLKLPYFETTIVFGNQSIKETDRKALARKLTQQVQSYFSPVVTPEPS